MISKLIPAIQAIATSVIIIGTLMASAIVGIVLAVIAVGFTLYALYADHKEYKDKNK